MGLAWIPSLCSNGDRLDGVLRSPGVPSSLRRNLGTMNSEMPFVPTGASEVRARTRWMMLSVRSWSPHVMKIFVPLIS